MKKKLFLGFILAVFVLPMNLQGFRNTAGHKLKKDKIKVYIFLAETCPICQYYTLELKKIYKKYHEKNIELIGVFPNQLSSKKTIAAFKEKYEIPFELILDKRQKTARKMKAKITPEVFVFRKKNLLYRGRIDNSYARIGKRRRVVTSFDLINVLDNLLEGKKIEKPKTQAIGCLITYKKK